MYQHSDGKTYKDSMCIPLRTATGTLRGGAARNVRLAANPDGVDGYIALAIQTVLQAADANVLAQQSEATAASDQVGNVTPLRASPRRRRAA